MSAAIANKAFSPTYLNNMSFSVAKFAIRLIKLAFGSLISHNSACIAPASFDILSAFKAAFAFYVIRVKFLIISSIFAESSVIVTNFVFDLSMVVSAFGTNLVISVVSVRSAVIVDISVRVENSAVKEIIELIRMNRFMFS